MRRISWGIQIRMQDMKSFLTPDLPPPAPQTRLLGPDPPGGIFFFKTPTHICVCSNRSARRGDHLEVCMLGYRSLTPPRSPPRAPPNRVQKVTGGCFGQGLSLSTPLFRPTTGRLADSVGPFGCTPGAWPIVVPARASIPVSRPYRPGATTQPTGVACGQGGGGRRG